MPMFPFVLPSWTQDPAGIPQAIDAAVTMSMISALVYDRNEGAILVSWQQSLHPETQKRATVSDSCAPPADILYAGEQPDGALARILRQQAGLTLKGTGEFLYTTSYDPHQSAYAYTMGMYLCEVEDTHIMYGESQADHVAYAEWLSCREAFHEFHAMPDRFLREPLLDYLKEGVGFTRWNYGEGASKQQKLTGLAGRRGAVSIPRVIR